MTDLQLAMLLGAIAFWVISIPFAIGILCNFWYHDRYRDRDYTGAIVGGIFWPLAVPAVWLVKLGLAFGKTIAMTRVDRCPQCSRPTKISAVTIVHHPSKDGFSVHAIALGDCVQEDWYLDDAGQWSKYMFEAGVIPLAHDIQFITKHD